VGNKLREVYADVWIDLALRQPEGRKAVIIISDLRYPNEAAKVRAMGGVLVKVTRDVAPVSNDVADTALANYNEWDMTLTNNGTREELQSQLVSLVNIVETLHGLPSAKKQSKKGKD
jgi:hypothetical protein